MNPSALVLTGPVCDASRMAKTPYSFTHSHVLQDDGSLSFGCATDPAQWPWLALSPHDPIVVQTLNYYSAYETAIARGDYGQGQWTALTETDWRCGEPSVGHAVRGIAQGPAGGGGGDYLISFFDRDDALVCELSGKGVVFRNRDFAAWRRSQKQCLGAPLTMGDFPYVTPELVGMDSQIESYLSTPETGSPVAASALVTMENGFPPAHPYHDGSGDHVNAAHLADAALQFFRLTRGKPDLVVTSGAMSFEAFVELGYPFRLQLESFGESGETLAVCVSQAGRVCATIRLHSDLTAAD